jgi:ribulose kinase
MQAPGLYLNEAGQSAAGSLLDHLIETHAAYPQLLQKAEAAGGLPLTLVRARTTCACRHAARICVWALQISLMWRARRLSTPT